MKFTKPQLVTFQAVKTKIVDDGEEVSFRAQVAGNHKGDGLAEKFLAVEDCRATPDNNFDSNYVVTLIENG